ncbi:Ricin-type beta-trefoil lectin domain-containing protein [Lentzea jiangxiensis]|uniref:Ricin-type beta-trefoil lectin domain-containing protein n=1 Tax=Lentzea jiangxiensis TaxID=641025 RepID=A0A1H0MQK8_9PSEU|nr:Ricin-type beta-trefoil lectin domain-containing protein [Lentzea jiangxiensis]
MRPSGGDSFELVNRASGKCLSAPTVNNYAVQLDPCDGSIGNGNLHWRIGSTTAAGQTLQNTETGHCLIIDSPPFGGSSQVMVTTCNSDQSQQLWRNDETA